MNLGTRRFIEFPGMKISSILELLMEYSVLTRVAPNERTMIIDATHRRYQNEFIFVGDHTNEREAVEKVLTSYFFELECCKKEDKEVPPFLIIKVLDRHLIQRGFCANFPEPTEKNYLILLQGYSDLLEIIVEGTRDQYDQKLRRIRLSLKRLENRI